MFKYKFIFRILILLISGIFFLFGSCSKSDCFNSGGKISEETRVVEFFDKIEVQGYFKIVLENNSINSIKIRTKKDFISNIKTTIKDSVLILEDQTKCNFTRPSANPPELIIGTNFLREIHVYQPVSLSTTDTLKLNNLLIRVYTEISDCNIILQTEAIAFETWTNATGNYYLSGKTTGLNMLIDGPGFVDARNLISDYAAIRTVTMNDIYVTTTYSITANIESKGNVIVYGNPQEIKENAKSTGKIILR